MKLKTKKSKIFFLSILSVLLILLVLPILLTLFDSMFPTKSNIIELLKEENLFLKDDFEIVRYKNDYITSQESFSIKISISDNNRIVKKLISSDEYKENVDAMYDIRLEVPRSNDKDKKYVSSYKRGKVYGFQTFKTRSDGYAPDWVIIEIPEKGNILYYDKFE